MNMSWLAALAVLIILAGCAASRRGAPPPAWAEAPAVAGVEHRVGSFRGAGELELFARSWRPEGPAIAALIVVHGLRDHSGRYAEAAQALARAGVAVHAFDLRGHGRSPGERVYIERFTEYQEDLGRFLAQVRAREPGVPVFMMGHSMGGAIVTSYVREARPELAGVVLSAAALQPGADLSPLLIRVTKRLGERHPRWRVLRLKPRLFSRDPEVVRENAKTDPLIDRRPGPARTAAELLRTLEQIAGSMEQVRAPLLILHGGADRITDPAGSAALHQRAGSPDKTLKIYPGLYHDLLHEPERALVLAEISSWLLARVPAPPGP